MSYTRHWGAGLAGAVLTLAGIAASCGGDAVRGGAEQDSGGIAPQTKRDIAVQWGGGYGSLPLAANLSVEPATYEGDATAQVVPVATPEGPGRVRIDIRAEDAQRLTVLSVKLHYDPLLWHADGGMASGELAQGDSGLTVLELTGEVQPGHLEHTQALAPLDSATGFSGDGVLASLWLAAGPAKGVSAAFPQLPKPQEVSYDPLSQEIRWAYNLAGDYDQNGEVSTSDLVNLARHFRKESPLNDSEPRGFALESIESVVDGDGNGLVGLGDLTVIGKYLGATLSRYEVFGSLSYDDYPGGTSSAPADPGYLVGEEPYLQYEVRLMAPAVSGTNVDQSLYLAEFSPALGQVSDTVRNAGRLFFTLPYAKPDGQYLWLRARRSEDYGPASRFAGHPIDAPPYGYPEEHALMYDSGTQTLSWRRVLHGDYNGNGEVTILDIPALGAAYGTAGPNVRDGNGDYVFDELDLRAIGMNLQQTLENGYDLFRMDTAAEVPIDPAAAETNIPVLEGLWQSVIVTTPGWYYVRYDRGQGLYGLRSHAVEVQ